MTCLKGVDEGKTVREITRVPPHGGWLALNGPAVDGLCSSPDLALCGVRRYEECKVRPLPVRHKLCPQMTHYWNAWLLLPLLP